MSLKILGISDWLKCSIELKKKKIHAQNNWMQQSPEAWCF